MLGRHLQDLPHTTFKISGGSDVYSLLSEKSDGTFVLALWREPPMWNSATGTAISSHGENITVSFDSEFSISLSNPIEGTSLHPEFASNSIAFELTDEPIFLTLSAVPVAIATLSGGSATISENAIHSSAANGATFDLLSNVAGHDNSLHIVNSTVSISTNNGIAETLSPGTDFVMNSDGTISFMSGTYTADLHYGQQDIITVHYSVSDGSTTSAPVDYAITINGAPDLIFGNGVISGTSYGDQIYGDSDPVGHFSVGVTNDIISGGAGDDALYGGDGDDVLDGGPGNDILDGGSGVNTASYIDAFSADGVGVTVDLTRVGVAQDTHIAGMDTLFNIQNIIGSSYDDTLTGDANANNIQGGFGNDTINGGDGNDYLLGNQGDDVITGGNGDDYIHGGQGNDILYGNVGNDELHGGVGDDTLYGGQGDDTLYGDSGNDVIEGGLGNDVIDGGTGINTASYTHAASTDGVGVTVDLTQVGVAQDTHIAGMDTLFNIQNIIGSSYDDTLTGDANANNIQGGAGNDTINGGAGDDTLYGNVGNDELHGGVGNDTLYGGQGNDTLYGDSGTNTLFGNLGADTFVMDPTGHDTIGDFSQAQGDKIDLSRIDAISNNAPGTLDHFTYVAGGVFTGAAGQLIIVQTDVTHYLVEGDTNGDGHADYILNVSSPDGTAPNQNAFTASSFAAAAGTTDVTHAIAHESFLFG